MSADQSTKGSAELMDEDDSGGTADCAVSGFDDGLVDLLAWILDTETRTRIYAHLRQHLHLTSEEVAEGIGLYPSTVREALAELTDDEMVEHCKRKSSGAGNNPYEYAVIAPSDLAKGVSGQVQAQLNVVFNLDRHLGTDRSDETEPVTITVREEWRGVPTAATIRAPSEPPMVAGVGPLG